MDNVSRPLIAVLVGTVAFFALWLVALKPSSSSTTGKPEGLGRYQSAIDQAHRAVATANAASAAEGGTVAKTLTPGARARQSAASGARTIPAAHAVHVKPTPDAPLLVAQALARGKVIAMLFYNPAGIDDQAVEQELAAVPTYGGRVVKLALPLSQLSTYSVVTNEVPVQMSPTLVLVDRSHQASTIEGFADRFEISQRVLDALGS